MNPEERTSRGILNPKLAEQGFELSRHLPGEALSNFVDYYWIIKWDLAGQPAFRQETLPFPSVNLVIESGKSRIFGVVSGKYSRMLKDQGRLIGIRFRPGGFFPFAKFPISKLTDTSMSIYEIFRIESKVVEKSVLASGEEAKMVNTTEDFLLSRLPEYDENVETTNQIIDFVASQTRVLRVEDISKEFPLSSRTLQRLFNQYVGVSPKWVIKRYRLQEAAERLEQDAHTDRKGLASDLGYFDQSHFIKDFKSIIGVTPGEYTRHVGEYLASS